MVLSGVAFALFENFWVLLLAAVVGVISATGGDFGPFRAIEESTLSHLTTPKNETRCLGLVHYDCECGVCAGCGVDGKGCEFFAA